jgi:hypothetical protein
MLRGANLAVEGDVRPVLHGTQMRDLTPKDLTPKDLGLWISDQSIETPGPPLPTLRVLLRWDAHVVVAGLAQHIAAPPYRFDEVLAA